MSRPVSLTIAHSSSELAESSDDPRRRLLLRACRLVNSDTKAVFRNPACQGSKSMKRRESTTLPRSTSVIAFPPLPTPPRPAPSSERGDVGSETHYPDLPVQAAPSAAEGEVNCGQFFRGSSESTHSIEVHKHRGESPRNYLTMSICNAH